MSYRPRNNHTNQGGGNQRRGFKRRNVNNRERFSNVYGNHNVQVQHKRMRPIINNPMMGYNRQAPFAFHHPGTVFPSPRHQVPMPRFAQPINVFPPQQHQHQHRPQVPRYNNHLYRGPVNQNLPLVNQGSENHNNNVNLAILEKIRTLTQALQKKEQELLAKKQLVYKKLPDLPSIDLSEPLECSTGWNASLILNDFLYIGAGYDKNHKCLVTNPFSKSHDRYVSQRNQFLKKNKVKFFLNMAGHKKQKQLKNISYDAQEAVSCNIPMNDVDSWPGETMLQHLQKGCDFLTKAYYVHSCYKKKHPDLVAPKVLVHCVAGVNRSAFVVVWWLVKVHKLFLKDAWNLVVERRDIGVNWANITLGGEISDEVEALFENIEANLNDNYFFPILSEENDKAREQQHLFVSPNASEDILHIDLTKEIIENSKETLISATEGNEFKKYIWYKKANQYLSKDYKYHFPDDSEYET